MFSIELTYNPYLVETTLVENGTTLEETHDLMNLCNNRRVQDWMDRFLNEMVRLYREKEIQLIVSCTDLDAEDVRDSVKQFNESNGNTQIILKINDHEQSVDEKVKQLKSLFEKAQRGPFEEFRGEKLTNQFNDALSPEFEVNVIATMSSGKSTVINAMLGQDLMPSKNEACTATIARIEDCDEIENFTGRRLDASSEVIDDFKEVTKEILTEWNEDAQTSILDLKGNIKSVQQTDYAKLVFIDTPGPNNSRDLGHRKTMVDAINRKPLSMVLYVLNATQLNIDDDASLLELVSGTMKTGGRQAQDRFVFIANKIDAFDPEAGESVASALENAKSYLQSNGIENPLIIPASAELAKLIRMAKLNEELTRSQRNNLSSYTELFIEEDEMDMLNHAKSVINTRCHGRLLRRLDASENDHDRAEILSGIPIVEELFNEFLQKHAVPAKIKDAVDSFHHVMVRAEGMERLNEQLEKNEADLQDSVHALESFDKNKERIEAAKKFRKKVTQQKYKQSKGLKEVYKGIQTQMFELLEDMTEDFSDEVNPSKATRLIKRVEIKCEKLMVDIGSTIQEGVERDFLGGLNAMRDEYEQYINDLLEKEFPSSEDMELLEFQKTAMQLPDIKSLVSENKYEKETSVGSHQESDSSWYNPFSWGRKKTVTDYEYTELVDMGPIWDELNNEFRLVVQTNIDNGSVIAEKKAEEGKQILLSAMDDIDRVWQENLAKMKSASKDKSQAEKQIAENQQMIDWYAEFRTELNDVLAI